MKIKTLKHEKFITKSNSGVINGFLIPIYNIHDVFDNDKTVSLSHSNLERPHKGPCFT